MSDLKPCPFCGGDNIAVRDWWNSLHETGYFVECYDCGAMVGFMADDSKWVSAAHDTDIEAIAAWNTRASVEYDGWFYLPKPKEGFVQYGEPSIVESGDGYTKVRVTVDVIASAVRAWGNELDDYVMKRICEVFNPVETCRITASATDGLCSDNPRQRFELSCGHSFTVDGLKTPVACPVCGKVVKQ